MERPGRQQLLQHERWEHHHRRRVLGRRQRHDDGRPVGRVDHQRRMVRGWPQQRQRRYLHPLRRVGHRRNEHRWILCRHRIVWGISRHPQCQRRHLPDGRRTAHAGRRDRQRCSQPVGRRRGHREQQRHRRRIPPRCQCRRQWNREPRWWHARGSLHRQGRRNRPDQLQRRHPQGGQQSQRSQHLPVRPDGCQREKRGRDHRHQWQRCHCRDLPAIA